MTRRLRLLIVHDAVAPSTPSLPDPLARSVTLPLVELFQEFPPHIRQRGIRYHEEGRVTLTHQAPDLIFAVVEGTEPYSVSIERVGRGGIEMLCDCPYYLDRGPCKHLFAVLLAAQAEGAEEGNPRERDGQGPPSSNPVNSGLTGTGAANRNSAPAPRPEPPEWQRRLDEARRLLVRGWGEAGGSREGFTPLDTPLQYRLDLDHLGATGDVIVEVVPARGVTLTARGWLGSADRADRGIARALLGAESSQSHHGYRDRPLARRYSIPPELYGSALRRICASGRCTYRALREHPLAGETVRWMEGGIWDVGFAVEAGPEGDPSGSHRLVGWFQREEERLGMEDPLLMTFHGLLLCRNGLARVRGMSRGWALISTLRREGPLSAPAEALFELAAEAVLLPDAPEIALPDSAGFEEVRLEPRPRLMLHSALGDQKDDLLLATVSFDYGGHLVDAEDEVRGVVDRSGRRIVRRTPEKERAALARLEELGVSRRSSWKTHFESLLTLLARDLDRVVQTLVAEGWHVEAHGRLYRSSTGSSASVRSGIDWFDLDGWVEFGEARTSLPASLAALARGERLVTLDDGTVGILPMEWLQRYAKVAELGSAAEDSEGNPAIRFRRGQAALLDALLAEQPEVSVDAAFDRIRRELASFDQVKPAGAPRGFQGELRDYQKDGLGWMGFLRRLGLGGCLADDMGLGKTVQVLALLEKRRQAGAGPSLAVVPKSLVTNWVNEAAHFTPRLRVRDFTGPDRREEPLESGTFDLLVTTYGTLRRDAPELAGVGFDYVILDEAQAIKNPDSATAKAARLLKGEHRLALSGTPIENHLGELWSLFEFLNPGMLGSAGAFRAFRSGEKGLPADIETQRVLSRALRPFLLRRTKDQVAPELPARTEQTVFIDLTAEQRRIYDGLRARYREELLGKVDDLGIRRSKMHILEALLRLRQAACHPGLLDPGLRTVAGAKLPLLVQTLEEVVEEGHRALVFSQFTSFLALVRERLDRAGISYEYLDGQTRDRQALVDRFQAGGDPVFLISLRAGGYGLNLTAADYVFLLDPWWNPAVEAQAIDRTHRIGQTKPVVAMRFIARDTVEEKVLELQKTKRELADAVLGENAGLLSRITREDLELLLG